MDLLKDIVEKARPLHLKKPKSLSDIIDLDLRKQLLKVEKNLTMQKMFSPIISKLITYSNKTVMSCSLDKFNKKFKLGSDSAILEVMDEIYELGVNPILAGGKLVSYVSGDLLLKNDNDYDLYFTSMEEFNKCHVIFEEDERFECLARAGYLIEYLFTTKFSTIVECEDGSFTTEPLKVKIQIMNKTVICVEELIEAFDFRCCAIAYSNGEIYWVKGSIKDVKRKKLIVNTPRSEELVFLRAIKYINKGYTISVPDLVCLSVLQLDSVFSEKWDQYHKLELLLNRDFVYDRDHMYPEPTNVHELEDPGPWTTGGETGLVTMNVHAEQAPEWIQAPVEMDEFFN